MRVVSMACLVICLIQGELDFLIGKIGKRKNYTDADFRQNQQQNEIKKFEKA